MLGADRDAVDMSFVQQVAALRSFFGVPDNVPLQVAIQGAHSGPTVRDWPHRRKPTGVTGALLAPLGARAVARPTSPRSPPGRQPSPGAGLSSS